MHVRRTMTETGFNITPNYSIVRACFNTFSTQGISLTAKRKTLIIRTIKIKWAMRHTNIFLRTHVIRACLPAFSIIPSMIAILGTRCTQHIHIACNTSMNIVHVTWRTGVVAFKINNNGTTLSQSIIQIIFLSTEFMFLIIDAIYFTMRPC